MCTSLATAHDNLSADDCEYVPVWSSFDLSDEMCMSIEVHTTHPDLWRTGSRLQLAYTIFCAHLAWLDLDDDLLRVHSSLPSPCSQHQIGSFPIAFLTMLRVFRMSEKRRPLRPCLAWGHEEPTAMALSGRPYIFIRTEMSRLDFLSCPPFLMLVGSFVIHSFVVR
jgi:hypothetical protein